MRPAVLLSVGTALALITAVALGQELLSPAVLPMAVSNTWVYTGMIRWTPAGPKDVLEKEIDWTMGIIDAIERRGLPAAVLEGHPSDFAWYEGRQRHRHLVVAIGEARTEQLYVLSDERAREVEAPLHDPSDSLIDLLNDYELFLHLPLSYLKRFCDLHSRTRYRVSYRTPSDHRIVDYVSGVGITSYVYGHQGTGSEVDVRLAETKLEAR